jgi:hypothetical protein
VFLPRLALAVEPRRAFWLARDAFRDDPDVPAPTCPTNCRVSAESVPTNAPAWRLSRLKRSELVT